MHWNLVDVIVLSLLSVGAWRGAKRGLTQELPSVVGLSMLLLTGWGVFRWILSGVEGAPQIVGMSLGLLGFGGSVAAAVWLTLRIRRRIRDFANKKFPDPADQRCWGAAAGAARAFLISAYIILFISTLPIGFLKKPFTHGSFLGYAINVVLLPVYQLSREEDKPAPKGEAEQNADPARPTPLKKGLRQN